jgi:hypothetical protein
LHYEGQLVNAVREMLAVYCENHTKHINTLRRQISELPLMLTQVVHTAGTVFLSVKYKRRSTGCPARTAEKCHTCWILTAVSVKSTGIWVVKPCSSENARRVEGTVRLRLQGRIVNQKNQDRLLVSDLLLGLLLDPDDGGGYVPPKRRTFFELHGVATQKVVLFKYHIPHGS